MTSVQRAGHSNWLIGGIAALAILSVLGLGAVELQRIDDNSYNIKTNAAQSTRIAQAQQALKRQQNELKAQQAQEDKDVACIATYNAAVRNYNAKVSRFFAVRNATLRAITVAIVHGWSQTSEHVNRLRRVFLAADARYEREHDKPLPQFMCQHHKPAKLPKVSTPSVPPGKPTFSPNAPRPGSTRVISGGSTAHPKAHGHGRAPHGRTVGHRHHPRPHR